MRSPLLRFLAELQADAPAVCRLLEEFYGGEGTLLNRLLVQLRPAAQSGHYRAQILQGQEMDRRGEKDLAAAIVVMSQQLIQNRPFFFQLGKVGFQSQISGLGNILLPVPVWDKGISVVKAFVTGTGVLWTLPAKLDAAVFQGTFGYGAALVTCSAAAAGTMPA